MSPRTRAKVGARMMGLRNHTKVAGAQQKDS